MHSGVRIPRLTGFDKMLLASLHLQWEAPAGSPGDDSELFRLRAECSTLTDAYADLRNHLRRMRFERDLYRRRFLWALSTAVGLAAGVGITVISLWWLMAGMR